MATTYAAPVPRPRARLVNRKAGVMAVVECSGEVVPGQPITVTLPDSPRIELRPV